jgi:hypothetical protein
MAESRPQREVQEKQEAEREQQPPAIGAKDDHGSESG